MTMARLVTGLVLMTILGIAHSSYAQSRPCDADQVKSTVVQVDGAPLSATAIRERLGAVGVRVVMPEHNDASCVSVYATVIQLSSGLSVALRDREGRSARRLVSTESIAATWIESWSRRDLGAPLMPAVFLRQDAGADSPSRKHAPPSASSVVKQSTSPASLIKAWTVVAASESVSGNDRSDWRTVSAGFCAELGPLCVGFDGRFGEAGDLSANQGETLARRRAADLLLSVRAPIALGRAVLSPSVGVGLGWMHTRRDEHQDLMEPLDPADPNNPGPCDVADPTFPDCDPGFEPLPPYHIGDGFNVNSLGPRLQAGVALTLPVTRQLAVELGVGVVFSPSAHDNAFDPSEGDSTMSSDGVREPIADPFFQLPGEPERMTWWSLGLRLELP